MNELERAWALMDELGRRAAERVVASPFGWGSVHEGLNRVYDLNYLRVTEPEEAAADELIAEAERIHDPAHFAHGSVRLDDAAAVDRLEPGFADAGWNCQRLVVMARLRAADRSIDTSEVRVVDVETMRPVWAAGMRRDDQIGGDEEVISQLIRHKGEVTPSAVPTTYFAAFAGGAAVSSCELYSLDGVGQIESVMTDEAYRGRGLARAVVTRAAEESQSLGHELTFLVAVADDWPRELYRKLGFDEIGSYGTFLRT